MRLGFVVVDSSEAHANETMCTVSAQVAALRAENAELSGIIARLQPQHDSDAK